MRKPRAEPGDTEQSLDQALLEQLRLEHAAIELEELKRTLRERAQAVAARERELEAQEEELDRREAAVAAREVQLEHKQRALDEAVRQEAEREREFLRRSEELAAGRESSPGEGRRGSPIPPARV